MLLTFKHVALFQCIILFAVCLTQVWAEPYIPKNDGQVLEHVSSSQDPLQRKLRPLRKAWEQDPKNLPLALQLAKRYREIGRTSGDPRYYGYAQATLFPWWDLPEPPIQVVLLRGILRQARHEFTKALDDLSRVLKVQPYNAQGWLTQAMIYQVRGDFERARQSCLHLVGLTSDLVATTCAASVGSLSGQATESFERLEKVLNQTSSDPARVQLWALTVLADIAVRVGDHLSAERYFTRARAFGIQDTYLLEAYSDFLLDTGRAKEILALLQKNQKPDGLLLRLALAEQQLKISAVHERVASLRRRFSESRLRGDLPHLQLEARFALSILQQPEKALALAQENWNIQGEPWDARIFLEAALNLNQPQKAQPVLEWMESVHLEDVRLQKVIDRFP